MDLETMVSEYTGLWCLICLMLVYFMQAGFAMVETGLTRAKNAGNIIMKNMMDFCIGTVAFMLLGYSLICGTDVGGLIGMPINTFTGFMEQDWAGMFFNLVFCATAATIVSGAMAERTKFASYCIYSFVISLVIYPIEAHWIWGGGWLAQRGFVDFAGSTAVHMCGGVAALVGAKILGPRIDKYTIGKGGKKIVNAIPGHSITLTALGVFILWFCWYGFNGAATTSVAQAGQVLSTTTLAAAFATVTTMLVTWVRYGKPDVSMTLNGALAGLVGITAGCANVDAVGAIIIGIICGTLVVFAVEFFDQKVFIDDPVGAISVHGCCGATGTLLVGLFDYQNGLFYGGGTALLITQVIGVAAVIAWVATTMIIVFKVMQKTIGIRATKEEEIIGLDLREHGLASAYADFMPVPHVMGTKSSEIAAKLAMTETTPVADAVPVTSVSLEGGSKIHKVVILTKQSKFDDLKHAMNDIGINGMTVANVVGCGIQKGAAEYYRGAELDVTLLPKIKMEIVVTAIPVETVVEAAKKVLYTGHIGDGKIFIYDVVDVVKVRTGETGYDALQD